MEIWKLSHFKQWCICQKCSTSFHYLRLWKQMSNVNWWITTVTNSTIAMAMWSPQRLSGIDYSFAIKIWIMHLVPHSIPWHCLWQWSGVVLGTVPNWCFSSGPGLELNWNHCNGYYMIKKPNCTEPADSSHVPHFYKLRTLAPIQDSSSDLITRWYIHKWCSLRYSCTSQSRICDQITIR